MAAAAGDEPWDALPIAFAESAAGAVAGIVEADSESAARTAGGGAAGGAGGTGAAPDAMLCVVTCREANNATAAATQAPAEPSHHQRRLLPERTGAETRTSMGVTGGGVSERRAAFGSWVRVTAASGAGTAESTSVLIRRSLGSGGLVESG